MISSLGAQDSGLGFGGSRHSPGAIHFGVLGGCNIETFNFRSLFLKDTFSSSDVENEVKERYTMKPKP